MKRHCHNGRDTFCGHYESKTGFLHGQIESKMAQNRAFLRHIPVLLTVGSASPGGYTALTQSCTL